MARISPPSRPGLLARIGRWYARRRYGRELAPADAWAHRPALMAAYGGLELAFERSGEVDRRLRTLAELKAATVAGCEWCADFGSMLGRHEGVSDRQMLELPRHRESDAFSEIERQVLDYADAMTRTPVNVPEELVDELRRRLGEAGLVELTTGIALENLRARFNWALGIQAQGFSEGAACAVPERQAA